MSMAEIGVRVIRVLERPDAGWTGEAGFITASLVRAEVEPTGYVFLVAGPPAMVAAMNVVMDELGVPKELRLIEAFGTVAATATT